MLKKGKSTGLSVGISQDCLSGQDLLLFFCVRVCVYVISSKEQVEDINHKSLQNT
jgi:hypothetical protein